MARNVPSPCCGSFSVLIEETIDIYQDNPVTFICKCPICKSKFGDAAESRDEALYNYDATCLRMWKQNPNGLNEWMKTETKDTKDVHNRIAIAEILKKYI